MGYRGAARWCIRDNNTCLHQAAICHGANTHVARTPAVTLASALGGCISISGPGGTWRPRTACSPTYAAVWSVSVRELLPSVWANTVVVCSSGLFLQQLWGWRWRWRFFTWHQYRLWAFLLWRRLVWPSWAVAWLQVAREQKRPHRQPLQRWSWSSRGFQLTLLWCIFLVLT